MAGRIEVTMESTYRGDLSRRLREDKQKLDAFQKWLDRSPLRVPVKLDVSGVKAQAAAMREAILGEFAKAVSSLRSGRPFLRQSYRRGWETF